MTITQANFSLFSLHKEQAVVGIHRCSARSLKDESVERMVWY